MMGFGTWKSDKEKLKHSIMFAIETGYRHIDCAAAYDNEKVVGEKGRIITTPQGEKSVKQSGLDCITVNIEELMAYRQTRFNNV